MDELRGTGAAIPRILSSVIGLTLSCITIDVLHCVDLGVSAHLIGNLFYLCALRDAWKGGSTLRNIDLLDEEMVSWCKKHRVESRVRGKLTLERLRSASRFPKLKAKGAATRHLIDFALDLARRHLAHDKRIIVVAQLMSEFYRLLHADGVIRVILLASSDCRYVGLNSLLFMLNFLEVRF